jgi:ribosomal protein S18
MQSQRFISKNDAIPLLHIRCNNTASYQKTMQITAHIKDECLTASYQKTMHLHRVISKNDAITARHSRTMSTPGLSIKKNELHSAYQTKRCNNTASYQKRCNTPRHIKNDALQCVISKTIQLHRVISKNDAITHGPYQKTMQLHRVISKNDAIAPRHITNDTLTARQINERCNYTAPY